MSLNLWRRHTPECPHRGKGRTYIKCTCPIWVDGELHGKRFRRTLKVRDWQRALKRLAILESPDAPVVKPVSHAVTAWLDHLEVAESSKLRYRRVLRRLEEFCKANSIESMAEVGVEILDQFRSGRTLSKMTSMRELQILRQFFGFCHERRWVSDNHARKIQGPRKVKPKEVLPYSPDEVSNIIAACGKIGRTNYERLRAKAMVLLMRLTGLRISDAATLAKARVSDETIMLYTQKTAGHVLLPIPPELQSALAVLPTPRGAKLDCPYFFWNGVGSRRTVIGRAERTMCAVFRKSGVTGAHAHRFRHTLATEVLARGGTIQDAADILGISPSVALRHYAKWSAARQERILTLMKAVHPGTVLAQSGKKSLID